MSTFELITTTELASEVQFVDFDSLPWSSYFAIILVANTGQKFTQQDPNIEFKDFPAQTLGNRTQFRVEANATPESSGNNSFANPTFIVQANEMARYNTVIARFITKNPTKFGNMNVFEYFGDTANSSLGGYFRTLHSHDNAAAVGELGDLRLYARSPSQTQARFEVGSRFTWYGVN